MLGCEYVLRNWCGCCIFLLAVDLYFIPSTPSLLSIHLTVVVERRWDDLVAHEVGCYHIMQLLLNRFSFPLAF